SSPTLLFLPMQLSNSWNELNPFNLPDASSTQLSPGSEPCDLKQKRQQISPAAHSRQRRPSMGAV
ncbi:hypothetical protein RNI52_06390, partial [Labrys neptuniae]|uniref:hypothetical protein n=1 Tax=Labrys neptuniae TaxID=376174 RepID=UPI00289211DB